MPVSTVSIPNTLYNAMFKWFWTISRRVPLNNGLEKIIIVIDMVQKSRSYSQRMQRDKNIDSQRKIMALKNL